MELGLMSRIPPVAGLGERYATGAEQAGLGSELARAAAPTSTSWTDLTSSTVAGAAEAQPL